MASLSQNLNLRKLAWFSWIIYHRKTMWKFSLDPNITFADKFFGCETIGESHLYFVSLDKEKCSCSLETKCLSDMTSKIAHTNHLN